MIKCSIYTICKSFLSSISQKESLGEKKENKRSTNLFVVKKENEKEIEKK